MQGLRQLSSVKSKPRNLESADWSKNGSIWKISEVLPG
jgi:hypothetical protein